MALGGVACVAVTDDASTELWGDFWSLIGAGFYAVYAVLLKLMVGDEGKVHGPMLLGFVGLINLLIMWPFGVLLAVTGCVSRWTHTLQHHDAHRDEMR